jgi:hypothetical protein
MSNRPAMVPGLPAIAGDRALAQFSLSHGRSPSPGPGQSVRSWGEGDPGTGGEARPFSEPREADQ